jgi:hypothetical protein
MHFLIPALVLAAAAAFLALAIAGCGGSGTRTPQPSPSSPAAAPPVAKGEPAAKAQPPAAPGLDRAGLKARLEELARIEPPKDLNQGAMCYDMKAPPDRVEYVCPSCGERTLYALRPADAERKADFGLIQQVEWDLAACRRILAGIRDVPMKLDESRFCGKCSGEAAEPSLGLVVTHPEDGKERRTWGVTSRDLVILEAFLKGEAKFKGAMDREEPVRDQRDRISQLLGLGE